MPVALPERTNEPDTNRLLACIVDLELEVDRLRRRGRFFEREATATLSRIHRLCSEAGILEHASADLAEVQSAARALLDVVKDLHDTPGYHPAHDQVVAIAIRPLALQVYRWQQRLTGASEVKLRLELETDHVEWFPARFRHILDNLLAHALQYRDTVATDPWVSLGVQAHGDRYVLRLSENGVWAVPGEDRSFSGLFSRGPIQGDGLGAGLAVVRRLVEQSGGGLLICPRNGRGGDLVLTLPRYDLLDYLE